jgi:hypothetical protein
LSKGVKASISIAIDASRREANSTHYLCEWTIGSLID